MQHVARRAPAVPLILATLASCGTTTTAARPGSLDGGVVVDGGPAEGGLFADSGVKDATVPMDSGISPIVPGADAGPVGALSITPVTPTLTVTALTAPFATKTFSATGRYANGTSAPVLPVWSVDRIDIANIDSGSGVLTPTGGTFGHVTVTATLGKVTASTVATVALSAVINPTGISPAQASSLTSTTTPDPSVTAFAYPYDKTVFPRGLPPPEAMWNGGAAGDTYYVHLVAPAFDLGIFTMADPPSRATLPTSIWNVLATSAAAQSATVTLHRLTAGTAYASAQETWLFADANLSGTIYYWAIGQGQIVKLDLETGTTTPAFDSGSSTVLGSPTPINSGAPVSPPWEDNGSGKRCVACHSVSKDGSTLASVFSRASSAGPLGVYGVASSSIQVITDYTQSVTYDALTPNGAYAALNFSNETIGLVNTATGAPVASALDGVTNLCDPAFSPDGTLFAIATQCSGGGSYPVEFDSSNLGLYGFNATTAPYFSGPTTVLTGAGTGDAIAFPSFSPDSKFLFYQRGNYSRAKYVTNQHGSDDLFVAPAIAGATQVALDNANGVGVLPADSSHLNYAPTVNPIAAGGYIWVVFTSPRDYGNVMASPQAAAPNDATYANHKQLWVTAVNANIGTTDPSHPAFWLPGQDATTANMFGYWSLAPCKVLPADGGPPPSCSAGFDCCTGFCRAIGDAGAVCSGPPAGCHTVGEACTSTADCCPGTSGVTCTGGFCQPTAPSAPK